MARFDRREKREVRKQRNRADVRGTDSKPRLCVFKSLKYTYAQVVSDDTGRVIVASDTRLLSSDDGKRSRASVGHAKALGKKIAELAKDKKIKQVVFDRNGYLYHGRVAAVADGAREGGLTL